MWEIAVPPPLSSSTPSLGKVGRAMLVLCRKVGEKIHIGGNVCVTVVAVDRNKVRLGIEAPGDVIVMRQELLPHPPGGARSQGPVAGPHPG
jgi:carbon storage regulator